MRIAVMLSCLLLTGCGVADPGDPPDQSTPASPAETTPTSPTPTPDPGFITILEASTVPSGDAIGTGFSDTFRAATIAITDCQCLVDETDDGVCETFEFILGTEQFQMVQDGGGLSFIDADGETILIGGVNNDGSFVIGGVVPMANIETGVVAGDGAAIMEGNFTALGFVATFSMHMRAVVDGVEIDCQVTSDLTAREVSGD